MPIKYLGMCRVNISHWLAWPYSSFTGFQRFHCGIMHFVLHIVRRICPGALLGLDHQLAEHFVSDCPRNLDRHSVDAHAVHVPQNR